VALLGPEVVVDHLNDAGTAVAADRRTGPQAGDPFDVPDRRGPTDEQRADDQQDQIDASPHARRYPCHTVRHQRRRGGKVHPPPQTEP
jgi:hypothetical protein